ncbi:MAG: ABC transporter ATP-binding protein [Patescibacteria group bacterium]|nr:ABC transporter ATP-binding protein [Patescibacteria group bacterium]
MKPLLEARALTKLYEQGTITVAAVEGASLAVRSGEIVLIIGPSGSGKSTLLSMLGCILRPTSGALLLAGREVSGLPDRDLPKIRRRCFGFVFQSFHLFPFLTARENVETALRLRKVAAASRRERTVDLLTQCGLEERMDFYPARLSGGEKQRVAIARALVNDPEVIFADEPTGNLDSKSGQNVMSIIQHLNEEHGKTIVLITHETGTADHAERIIRLIDGQIESDHKVKNRLKADAAYKK